MSLLDAIRSAGMWPGDAAAQSVKKRYSELLSKALAEEVADGLRAVGFPRVRPLRGGPGEMPFQGGLGPKRVDVSYSDERHGLLLAVSIKTICFSPYGKNLKNRFGDLCTEAITLHMRFPYSVVCGLFALPEQADLDITPQRTLSTYARAMRLFGTMGGRADYASAGERFEDFTMLLFRPLQQPSDEPALRLHEAVTQREITEPDYFRHLRELFNRRNPHAPIGVPGLALDDE